MRQRLTPKEIEDIQWFRATFKKRPSVKKFRRIDPMVYLWPKGSFGEIALVFEKPVKTIEDVLKRNT